MAVNRTVPLVGLIGLNRLECFNRSNQRRTVRPVTLCLDSKNRAGKLLRLMFRAGLCFFSSAEKGISSFEAERGCFLRRDNPFVPIRAIRANLFR
ncbi:MAG: hypothetical protein PHY43_10670 [Verrucomicrobiales bacterium]|nr:hypothetical protein [Verrucomicrobiales bacterium]